MKRLDHNSKNTNSLRLWAFLHLKSRKINVINTLKQLVCMCGPFFMANLDIFRNRVHFKCPNFEFKNLMFEKFLKYLKEFILENAEKLWFGYDFEICSFFVFDPLFFTFLKIEIFWFYVFYHFFNVFYNFGIDF